MSARGEGRVVAGAIDAGGVYSSRIAAGGGFVFLAGIAMDGMGRVPASAQPPEPYRTSEAARARAQSRYAFERLRELLPEVGSSTEEICQLEQYVKLKVHADAYFAVAGDPACIGKARPGGATAQLAGYYPEDAAISFTGIAVAPEPGRGPAKTYPGERPEISPTGLFSSLVAAGPYVFHTFFPTDNKTGVHPSARADAWHWRGSEIRSEVTFGAQQLAEKLAIAGVSLSDIVNYTLFLADPSDLFEFDLAFAKALGPEAPSRIVVPARGFANPRREGAFGHEENAERMEIQVRALLPASGAKKIVVDGPGAGYGYQSAGVRVDPLLWVSAQYADPALRGSAAREAADVLDKIATVCRNGGTDIANVLRVHALVRRTEDAATVYAALRTAIRRDPPVVSVIEAPVLPVADASVVLDAVAYVPRD
ncbi:MAG: RidA family protein [Chloroflexota bacterium]|nr:RidA family protein [Chloroflexota bacterium]MDE3101657.1 RidA family protein [Chloroflexota bacterium]